MVGLDHKLDWLRLDQRRLLRLRRIVLIVTRLHEVKDKLSETSREVKVTVNLGNDFEVMNSLQGGGADDTYPIL